MRRQGASIFIYLIFGTLIAVFVINFGPQGGGKGGGGCTGTDNVVVRVDGHDATQTAFHVAYSNPYNRGQGKQRVYVALETIIRRELLANEADNRGFLATDDLILDQIKKGHFFLGGYKVTIPGALDDVDGEKFYNHKAVKSWVGQLNVSLNSYYEEQKRSLLAAMMAEILQDSVQVSKEEALSQFLYEGNTATYDVVAFKPDMYRSALRISDADVDRYLAAHEDDVKARYKADERTYKAVKPQLQLREIFIAKAEEPKAGDKPADDKGEKKAGDTKAGDNKAGDAKAGDKKAGDAKAGDKKAGDKKDDKKTANKKTADKTSDAKADKKTADAKADKKDDKKTADAKAEKKPAVKPVGMPIEQAQAKLEAARAAIASGKQKFADAARELSTDESLKLSGGDIGWRTADNASIGEKAVTDAIKTLKAGEMTPVIATDRGAYLVIAEAKREGDLSYDQVKHELAKEIARDAWSKEAARRAAIAALDEARAGTGKNLQQLYERELLPENPGQNFQNMSPEEQKRILDQLREQMGEQHGSIEFETKDIPAAWYADSGDTGGSPAGSAAAAGSAPPPAAAGSAPAPTPTATGSAAAPADAPAAKPPVTDIMAPSKEQLPQLGDVPKAKVNSFGPAPRTAQLPGIGASKELVDALFDELTPGMLAKRIYEANGGYYVVQLISRQSPKVDDFDKNADRRVSELRDARAQSFLKEWLKDRCDKLAKDGKIKPNAELVQERDDAGKLLPISYRPCMSF
ncbi:MAG: PpiC-type peptidyl-prolyl cis-trans isomerase [Myxococcales bacterium]|nr:PpiC-type peptidyl-prolyl cis-trans isomerase [Myxococcales bacterium]